MTKKHWALIVTMSVLAAAGVAAQTTSGDTWKWSIEGARLFGGDLGLSYGPWKAVGGLGLEQWDLGRDTATGAPRGSSSPVETTWVPNAEGLIRYGWDVGVGTLWAGATGTAFGSNWSSPAEGVFPDRNSGLFFAAVGGFTRDRTAVNAHRVKSGYLVDGTVEEGPSWLSLHATSYQKFAVQTSAFVPLWDTDTVRQTFSGVLALRLNSQWIDGSQVPIPLLEPTEVRGYYQTFDTKFRSVATTELRVGLPSLWGTADAIPMVFGFVDAGAWSGYSDTNVSSSQSGWLASVGGGVGLEVLGLATPTLTVARALIDPDATYWWHLNLNLRF